jgi:hypothetical protein
MKKMNGFNVHMPSGSRNEQPRGGPRKPRGVNVTVTVIGIVMVTVTRNLIRKKKETRKTA